MCSQEQGIEVKSFTIATVESNDLIRDIHARMPAMLLPEHEEVWLSEDSADVLKSILVPYPETEMKYYEISPAINSPKNESEEVIKPVST